MAGAAYGYEEAVAVLSRQKTLVASDASTSSSPSYVALTDSEGYEDFAVSSAPAKPTTQLPVVPHGAPKQPQSMLSHSTEIPSLGGSAANDWNARFLRILERVSALEPHSDTNSDALKLWKEVATLGQDFIYCAETYGRIIISEVALPDLEKTIKPLQMGGVLGGAKYVVGNILFKFALDAGGLFNGDDECAGKVANLDLRGLEHMLSTNSTVIAYPIIALIDYRGYRLLAISLLPIGSLTLVSGSATGSSSGVVSSDEEAAKELQRMGRVLNLAEHEVGGHTMHLAADLEIHRSAKDKRLYAVDFSRMFPPEKPLARGTNYLYTQMRPEFVRSYPRPLNPDSFSGFGSKASPEYNGHCSTVSEATDHLYLKVLPRFAFTLVSHFGIARNRAEEEPRDESLTDEHEPPPSLRLVRSMHEIGLNVRHLGCLRKLLPPEEHSLRTVLLIEMLARTARVELKRRLRSGIREARVALQGLCKGLVVEYVNQLLGSDFANDVARTHWLPLRQALAAKFRDALTEKEERGEENIRQQLISFVVPTWALPPSLSNSPSSPSFASSSSSSITGIALFFERLSKLCGLRWRDGMMLRVSKQAQLRLSKPLSLIDLVELEERVKTLSLFSFAIGASVFDEAMKYHATDTVLFNSIASQAIEHLESALDAFGSSGRTRRLLGRVLAFSNRPIAAERILQSAIELGGDDVAARLWYSQFLDTRHRFAEAALQLEQALLSDPSSSAALLACVEFSVSRCKCADVALMMFGLTGDRIPPAVIDNYQRAMQQRLTLRKTGISPKQSSVKETKSFNFPATAVWSLVSNFAHPHAWHPSIISTLACTKGTSTSSIRTFRLSTGTLMSERLTRYSPELRVLSYAPVGRYPAWPLESMHEEISVVERGANACDVEWSAQVQHMTSLFVIETALRGFYQAGLQQLELILQKSEDVVVASPSPPPPVWLRLAGISSRLRGASIETALNEFTSHHPALDEVAIMALYEWAEEPSKKARMSRDDSVKALIDAGLRSLHTTDLQRVLFRLLLKLSRQNEVARLLHAKGAVSLSCAAIRNHPTIEGLVQNAFVVLAHMSAETVEIRMDVFNAGAVDLAHEALERSSDLITCDRAIFLIVHLGLYAPAAERFILHLQGAKTLVATMTRFKDNAELITDACLALKSLVSVGGQVAATLRECALKALITALETTSMGVREAALAAMNTFSMGVNVALSANEQARIISALAQTTEPFPELRAALQEKQQPN